MKRCCFEACNLHNKCKLFKKYDNTKGGWLLPVETNFINGKCKHFEK